MFTLMLIWLLIGIVVGLLATAGKLRPEAWSRFGWLYMAGIGMGTAFCGGLLGILLVGRYFATAMALWVSVMGVVLVPSVIRLCRNQKIV